MGFSYLSLVKIVHSSKIDFFNTYLLQKNTMLLLFTLFLLSLYWLLSGKKVKKINKSNNDYMTVLKALHLNKIQTSFKTPLQTSLKTPLETPLETPLKPPLEFLLNRSLSVIVSPAVELSFSPIDSPKANPEDTQPFKCQISTSMLMNDISFEKDLKTGIVKNFKLDTDCFQ